MRLNINFKQIEAFRAVMKTGTTTHAAAVLHTTQPSISRRLTELQNATRLRLFALERGRLQPTEEGVFLYRAVEQHFVGLENIETIISAMRRSGTKSLRIACTPTLGVGWLPSVMSRFVRDFPDTHITVRTSSTTEIESLLDQDLVDIVFTTSAFRRQDVRPTVLERRGVVCILPLQHPLGTVQRLGFSRFAGERIISISEDDELSSKIKVELLQHGLSGHFALQTNSSITICALVSAGIGIGIVTPYVADDSFGKFIVRPLDTKIAVELRMAMPMSHAPSLLTREFIRIANGDKV